MNINTLFTQEMLILFAALAIGSWIGQLLFGVYPVALIFKIVLAQILVEVLRF